MTKKLGPLAKNHSTGKIERMVEEEYEVKVWDRPAECSKIFCIQETGSSICKTTCPAWARIQARIKAAELSFTIQKRTRYVFKEDKK